MVEGYPKIADIVNDMYEECMEHVDLYDSPAGLELKVGSIGWLVTYWPPTQSSIEQLSFTRDWPKLSHPVSYGIHHDGHITKNESIAERAPGGVLFDAEGDKTITDINEAFILQAVLKAAHIINR